eukprot:TRINITY_DN1784_c0_g1_i1.p1 TRINITY_DN1784_c0_g1~~TRINITY_DN1784_c0_g1_i1.p1  ORF type:complete len:378 (+),score=66.44 TRINITY_DN1784_c0_g1_i1:185-1318(+)
MNTPITYLITLLVALITCASCRIISEEGILDYEFKMAMPGTDTVTLYWTVDGDLLHVAMTCGKPGYIAFGINSETRMVGADAVVGWIDANGTSHIGTYNLTAKNAYPVEIPQVYQIQNGEVTYENGLTIMKFTRHMRTGQHNITGDTLAVMAGIGPIPEPRIHRHKFRTTPCCPLVDFKTGKSEETFNLRIIHGWSMVAAWTIILPVGVLCARYLRESKGALWFKVHRISQPVGFLVALVSLGLIIYDTQRTDALHFASPHPIGGLAVMILALFQVVWGVLRPQKDEKHKTVIRSFWEQKHVWLGRILLLISWGVTTFGMCHYTGRGMPQCISDPDFSGYFIGYFIIIGLIIVVTVALEIRMRSQKKHDYVEIHGVK